MAPKRAKNEPKRAPKDVEEHLYRGNADLSKSNKILSKIKVFEGRRVRLGGKFNTKRVQDKKTGNLNTPARDNTITTHNKWQDEAQKKKCLT